MVTDAEARYQSIIENAAEGIWTLDANGRIDFINPRGAAILGYNRDELLGHAPNEFRFPEDLVNDQAGLPEQLTEREFRLRRKDGSAQWVHVSDQPLRDARGRVTGAVSVFNDITTRKHNEQELQQTRGRLDALFHGIPGPVVVYQKTERGLVFVDYNRATDELTRGNIGSRLYETIDTMYADLPAMVEQAYRCLDCGQNLELETEYRLVGTGEPRHMVFTFVFVPEDMVMIHALDITDRVRAEQELRAANQELETRISERTSLLESSNEELRISNEELARQVAERLRTEERLRESQSQLDSFFANTPAGLVIYDDENRYVRVNQYASEWYGQSPDHLIGKSIHDVLSPDLARATEMRNRQVLADNHPSAESFTAKLPVHSSNPRETFWEGVRFPILLSTGKMGVGAVLLEVSERMMAEQALQLSEAKFSTAFHGNASAMSISRLRDGLYLDANDRWLELFGDTRGQAFGTSIPPIRWKNSEQRERAAHQLEADGAFHNWEVELVKPDGSDIVGIASAQVTSLQGEPVVITSIIDITERKRAERELERLNRELERRAAQLETINFDLESFTYSVSHDLRAPLSTIDGFSRILQEDFGPTLPREAQHYLQLIQNGTTQMTALIKSLLALSRYSRQPLHTEPVDMIRLVVEALETLQQEPQRAGLTLDILDLPPAEADPVLLKQVWVNLISNALKFTRGRDKSRIEIGTWKLEDGSWKLGDENCRLEAEDWRVEGGTEKGQGGADAARLQYPYSNVQPSASNIQTPVYYVRDNGVGFDMSQADRLFGVFQRLHAEEDYEGTGVGLAIVQRIIRRHGGRVWAEAEPGVGATFFFTLG